jgi:arylsulfatase A-like enzyme
MKCPGSVRGKVVSNRVSSIDLMPTILDVLDVKFSEKVKVQLRGRSLVPAVFGEATTRPVYSETDYREHTFKRSIISPDGWKLIYTLEESKKPRELYDLNTDPGETMNRADAEPERSKELEDKLFDHFASIGHDLRIRRWERGLNPVYNLPKK